MMSSNVSKEAKTAAKAQKKTQKSLQKKQQQQQKQTVKFENGINSTKNATATTAESMQTTNNGVGKMSAQKSKVGGDSTAQINNNNSEAQNNYNITQKLRAHLEAERKAAAAAAAAAGTVTMRNVPPGYENAQKFERSSSFSLKGKLSKLFNTITGSKENLNKAEDETPYKLTRSRSMILLRRSNRRSLIEPQLEQLSEEGEKSGDIMSPASMSPRKNSLETAESNVTVNSENSQTPATELQTTKSTPEFNFKTPRRQNSQPYTSTPLQEPEVKLQRQPSTLSLAPGEGNGVPFNPQLHFQKRRSNTLLSSFRNKLSGLTGEKPKKAEKLNPKWSASLQSLQAIDNMVSYKNMSFIDYDKFNGYEKQLERQLSTLSLMENQSEHFVEPTTPTSARLPKTPSLVSVTMPSPQATPQTVVRRRKTSTSSARRSQPSVSNRNSVCSGIYNSDYEHNLDKPRNVYRDSLDSRKLERLNDFSRDSFILDKQHIVDVLNLEDGSVGKRRAMCAHINGDMVDAKAVVQLKSKSLTHLDGLDSVIACQHGVSATPSAATVGKASTVSSSEYFSVSFCTEQGCQDEEFIPATKGVTLLNALSQALKRRNLSFSQIIITDNNAASSFLEAGYPPLASSLDENTDVENLTGHHLIIAERDGSRKTLQKAASFGSRTRPPRLLSSASTEETNESVPGKQTKQRWSVLFGIKNPQQGQLYELLNSYAKNGVPQKSAALNFDHPNFDAALEYLDNMHASWKDFVESGGMSDSETRIQTAIWEVVTTEVDYIHALQTVTDLFLACLEAVQEERLLTDVDQHRLFSNVRDICEANLKFWTLYLYPMVAHSVATREPMRIGFFQEGFITFAAIFAPYKKYCAEQSTCQFYCKELNRSNALFTAYLAWCEGQKMCNRLRLADILVRPMQRLTKYSLLLAAIKKHMSEVEEIEAVDTMIHIVENFVCSVNNHLTTRQENERLKGVMARLESYDVVDTNNEQLDKMIKQYSQMFDLCSPMKGCAAHHVRHLFMEGDHKFKDNLGKADVHCFLLTDMLLVCKTMAKKGFGALKVIRQPYLTDRLMVQHMNNVLNCVYLNEFQVAVTAFTLQCSEAKNWYESLKRAKMIYTRLKQGTSNWDSFRFGGSGASGGTADSLGVKKSPMNSSICSHVSSANNSHSGSVEWNDSRNISVDFEKTNSLSSDEGSSLMGGHGYPLKVKPVAVSPHKLKVNTSTANTLSVQPLNHLGQSLPNLTIHHSHTNLYHTYSNNTLLVPGTTTTSHSGNLLLSPSHRGISYPPPSPTRVPLRRGMAFSTSTKNPPLVKTRNITSQNSINWHQIPATPTPTSPKSQHSSPNAIAAATATTAPGAPPPSSSTSGHSPPTTLAPTTPNSSSQELTTIDTNSTALADEPLLTATIPLTLQNTLQGSHCQSSTSTETDV